MSLKLICMVQNKIYNKTNERERCLFMEKAMRMMVTGIHVF